MDDPAMTVDTVASEAEAVRSVLPITVAARGRADEIRDEIPARVEIAADVRLRHDQRGRELDELVQGAEPHPMWRRAPSGPASERPLPRGAGSRRACRASRPRWRRQSRRRARPSRT